MSEAKGGGLEEGGLGIVPGGRSADYSLGSFSVCVFRVVFQVTIFRDLSSFFQVLGVPGQVIFCDMLESLYLFVKTGILDFGRLYNVLALLSGFGRSRRASKTRKTVSGNPLLF